MEIDGFQTTNEEGTALLLILQFITLQIWLHIVTAGRYMAQEDEGIITPGVDNATNIFDHDYVIFDPLMMKQDWEFT